MAEGSNSGSENKLHENYKKILHIRVSDWSNGQKYQSYFSEPDQLAGWVRLEIMKAGHLILILMLETPEHQKQFYCDKWNQMPCQY